MLTYFNVQKTHYFSNAVHYCRSSMPRLSQCFVFYKVPPSDKHSLLWLANWHSALWLAEHHKPHRKCNDLSITVSFSFQTECKDILSFTISSSPKEEQSCVTAVNFGRHFWFSLSIYPETKMLNSLSHILVIWVFHSFSQTAVTKIYFGSYFICSIETKIVINSSLFRPNQLSLW